VAAAIVLLSSAMISEDFTLSPGTAWKENSSAKIILLVQDQR
jgi:hypothetical protein